MKRKGYVLPVTLLALAVIMMVIGSLSGQMDDVLTKAVHICMECIGLG